jgi:hypothetical protein
MFVSDRSGYIDRIMPRLDYATTLRCIAQVLEMRGLRTFDIQLQGMDYLVQCGYQNPPAPMPVTLKYTPKDIKELDLAGEKKRGVASPEKEFLNLVQVFRTIGGYLDKNEARLIRLCNSESPDNDPSFRVEYETRERERVVDDRVGSAIYDMCVTMYKQRGRMTGTGSKFRRKRF